MRPFFSTSLQKAVPCVNSKAWVNCVTPVVINFIVDPAGFDASKEVSDFDAAKSFLFLVARNLLRRKKKYLSINISGDPAKV